MSPKPVPVTPLSRTRAVIVARIAPLMAGRRTPVLIAIDGASGSGKSTVADLIVEATGAALIHSDDFYAAQISDAAWNARTPEARAADVIDWRRLRAEALEPLLAGRAAVWHAFDFDRPHADGTYPRKERPTRCEPAALIVMEGAYSSRPELADLIDLSVLVDSPADVRHARLARRETGEFLRAWHAQWDAAEEYYFSNVRPKSSFDLVVSN